MRTVLRLIPAFIKGVIWFLTPMTEQEQAEEDDYQEFEIKRGEDQNVPR